MARGKLPVAFFTLGLRLAHSSGFGGGEAVVVEGVVVAAAGVTAEAPSSVDWGSKRTLANFRLAAVYSQLSPPASQRLQRGKSPEHLVF